MMVQESLGTLFLRLVTSAGLKLNPSESLEAAGLQDGDQLTAVVVEPKLAATRNCFCIVVLRG